jgi:hypothetical protein
MGAIGTRLSLRPLVQSGETKCKPRTIHVARTRICVPRHCERSEKSMSPLVEAWIASLLAMTERSSVQQTPCRPCERRDPQPPMLLDTRRRNDESLPQPPPRSMGPCLRRDDGRSGTRNSGKSYRENENVCPRHCEPVSTPRALCARSGETRCKTAAHSRFPADGCTSSVGTPQVPVRTVITRVPGLRPVRISETSTPAATRRA